VLFNVADALPHFVGALCLTHLGEISSLTQCRMVLNYLHKFSFNFVNVGTIDASAEDLSAEILIFAFLGQAGVVNFRNTCH
jgi:DNA polymerase sigma